MSCQTIPEEIEIFYDIKEMKDYSLEVTFKIKNSTNYNFDSLWSLHWNQQSAVVDSNSVSDNLKYEYVAGQSYNILSFGKNYNLNAGESISIDLKQRGIVQRKSDLPVGGFIVINNNILDVKFTSTWKNAIGIEDLNIPTSIDRYANYYPNNPIDKTELDLIVPTPNKIIIFTKG